jgi:large subunit ribosomal protein L16
MLKKDLKKFHKNCIKGLFRNRNNKNSKIIYGSFGLKSLENGLINARHIEATRRILSRKLKKIAKIWIRIKPLQFVTSKAGDKRMGKGKGAPLIKIFKVRCGLVLFEIEGSNSKINLALLKKAKKKLPFKIKIVSLNNNF